MATMGERALLKRLAVVLIAGAVGLVGTARAQPVQTCVTNLVFDPTSGSFLTSDLVPPNSVTQEGVNCFAWQSFIALNWPVDPDWPADPAKAGEPDRTVTAATFGVPPQPGMPMTTATVWESFAQADAVFLPDAARPADWGTIAPRPAGCAENQALAEMHPTFAKVLSTISKSAIDPEEDYNLSTETLATSSDEIMEATGGWLTDQARQLVFFGRRIGKAEFDYIVQKRLYDAADQMRVATNADGLHPEALSLPIGKFLRVAPSVPQSQEDLGAIELKAAWRVLTGDTEQYGRHLTAIAWLKRPDTGTCSQEVIGLVGLHIIRKTNKFPDFVWATFEHVDNVPSTSAPPFGYAFHDPSCSVSNCPPNQKRIECDAGGSCSELFPRDAPVQVTREQPLAPNITEINTAVQEKIVEVSANQSVFAYYNLVNVLWDVSPNPPPREPGANKAIPIEYGTFQSEANLDVANTTMETYVQNTSCNVCHRSATITGNDTLASDFSFLFGTASSAQPGFVDIVAPVEGGSGAMP